MPRVPHAILVLALLAPALHAQAPADPAVAAHRQQLIAANGPGTDTALAQQLLTMRDQDQTARGVKTAAAPGQPLAMATNLTAIDSNLTTQLKSIVQQHGWPTIALVGLDASDAATLLLTHTADHAWQRSLLPQLTTLADQRKIDPAPLAFAIDKELLAEGKPQRYGTQFQSVDGSLAMVQVEDPGGLDSLRARTLLPPLDTYRAELARLYHLKLSNRILSPPPAAAAAPASPAPAASAPTPIPH